MNGGKITCFKVQNIKENVSFFYKKENENWHRNIHKRKGTVEENINNTVKTILDGSDFYLVKYNNKKAGFFGYYEQEYGKALVSFHVGKEFREKYFFIQFWNEIKKIFKTDFSVGIYEVNKRAINHLLHQGFKIINTVKIEGKTYNILLLKL